MGTSSFQFCTYCMLSLLLLRSVHAFKIQAFHFPRHVRENQRVQVSCGLEQEENDVQFLWYKDGLPLQSSDTLTISAHLGMSLFLLSKAKTEHSGNYTCVATNSLSQRASFSSTLLVEGPPKWISEPQDVAAPLDEPVSIPCSAIGYPVPEVTWRTRNGTDRWLPLASSGLGSNYRVEANGSLTILKLRPEDEGQYSCEVSNGIGEGLQKAVILKVKVPVRFAEKHSQQTVKWGETVHLSCEAEGDNPITISWFKNQKPISQAESTRYEIFDSITEKGTTSDLHIQGVSRIDNGPYSCVAKNAYGKDERTFKLVVLEVPSPPSDVKVENTWSRIVSLRWSNPYTGNSPIQRFIVQYWRDSVAPHKLEEEVVLPPQTTKMLRDLHPGTSYVVRVLAENEVGRSNPSDSQQFFTKEAEPDAPPTDVWVEARGAGALLIKFKAPPRDQWNGQLKAYHIGYKVNGSTEPYSYKTVEFSKDLEEEYKLTKLQKSTEYSIIVKASNDAGMGPASQEIIRKTSDTDPPAAPFLWVESQGGTSLGLRWDQKLKENEQITHYTLYYKEDGGQWSDLTIPLNVENKYLLTGLREGTRYRLYLKSVSPAGHSDPSEMLVVRTEGGALADVPHAGLPGANGHYGKGSRVLGYPDDEVPVYLRMSVLIPVGASVALVIAVVVGACLYVRREERRYRSALAAVAGEKRFSAGTLPHGGIQRYVDVEKAKPLIKGMPPPLPPPPPFPAPYATLPIRGPAGDKRSLAEGLTSKEHLLSQATLDRKRYPTSARHHIVQETAEIHHYDTAA